jgi:hypothetical protein
VLKIKSCVEDKKLCSKQKVVLKIKSCVENKNHTVKMMLQTKSCVEYYHAGHIQQIFSQYRRLAFSADLL